jgi:hypothetical protein
MIRKFIFASLIALCAVFADAGDMNIVLCREKNVDCQVIPIKDVQKVDRISNGTILRITFGYGRILDIAILGKFVDLRKNKK